MKVSRLFIILAILAAIILGAVIMIGSYLVSQKQQSEQVSTPISMATTTDASASSSPELSYPLPSATTTIPSSWKTYKNDELGYQISYPSDLVANVDGAVLTLAFPKAKYFHWPLQDDAKITITVASSCPSFNETGEVFASSTIFSLNGYSFTRNESHGAAAGNLYNEWAYDTTAHGSCYRIDLFNHGANGAGLYVDDQALISRYDATHKAELNVVMDVWNAAAASFRVISVPSGTPEMQVVPAGR